MHFIRKTHGHLQKTPSFFGTFFGNLIGGNWRCSQKLTKIHVFLPFFDKKRISRSQKGWGLHINYKKVHPDFSKMRPPLITFLKKLTFFTFSRGGVFSGKTVLCAFFPKKSRQENVLVRGMGLFKTFQARFFCTFWKNAETLCTKKRDSDSCKHFLSIFAFSLSFLSVFAQKNT